MLWNAPVKKIHGDLLLIMMICFRVYGIHLRRIQGDPWPRRKCQMAMTLSHYRGSARNLHQNATGKMAYL